MCSPLRREICKSSSEIVSKSVVVSLEGNADVFSLVCDPKIRIVEDVGSGVIEVRLVGFGLFSMYNGHVFTSVSTDDGVCSTGNNNN